MKVFTSLSSVKEHKFNKLAIALGTFDGVHIGHQKVIAKAVDLARKHGGIAAVLTFSTHPLSVINPAKTPLWINDTATKIRDIEKLGIDVLINIPFTTELAQLTPKEFMEMLRDDLHAEYVVTGPNFTFGYKGAGTPALLQQEGPNYGFQAFIQHFIYFHNDMVSSTEVRKAIEAGELEKVNRLLGRPFSINEEVVHGKKRGRLLGFPTANLRLTDERAMLPNGVYIVYAYVDGVRHEGVASIGTNPTFEDISRRVEVFILNFNEFIYGKIIRVDFLAKIRNEVRFSSKEALIKQMNKDIEKAKVYFAEHAEITK